MRCHVEFYHMEWPKCSWTRNKTKSDSKYRPNITLITSLDKKNRFVISLQCQMKIKLYGLNRKSIVKCKNHISYRDEIMTKRHTPKWSQTMIFPSLIFRSTLLRFKISNESLLKYSIFLDTGINIHIAAATEESQKLLSTQNNYFSFYKVYWKINLWKSIRMFDPASSHLMEYYRIPI